MSADPRRDAVVPYVVPSSYPLPPEGWCRPLGHDLHVVLAEDLGSLITPLRPDALTELGFGSLEACWQTALENIDKVFKKKVQARLFPPKSPDDVSLILCGDTWLAASCIVMPRLHAWATKHVPVEEPLLVSVPNPEALLLFPRGTRVQRDTMRRRIRDAETGHRKPLTWALFELGPAGLRPFVDDDA